MLIRLKRGGPAIPAISVSLNKKDYVIPIDNEENRKRFKCEGNGSILFHRIDKQSVFDILPSTNKSDLLDIKEDQSLFYIGQGLFDYPNKRDIMDYVMESYYDQELDFGSFIKEKRLDDLKLNRVITHHFKYNPKADIYPPNDGPESQFYLNHT